MRGSRRILEGAIIFLLVLFTSITEVKAAEQSPRMAVSANDTVARQLLCPELTPMKGQVTKTTIPHGFREFVARHEPISKEASEEFKSRVITHLSVTESLYGAYFLGAPILGGLLISLFRWDTDEVIKRVAANLKICLK